MVVKESRGRRRYVAFSLGRSVPKSELDSVLSSTACGQLQVIQCAGGWCIVRCEPWQTKSLIEMITKRYPDSESVSTSGNLITLRRRYPILWETRPRYIAFTVKIDGRSLSEALSERADDDGPVLKFCGSGYAILRCCLRDSEKTKAMMKDIDPSSGAFLSSYKSKDLRKAIALREPELRPVLLARK